MQESETLSDESGKPAQAVALCADYAGDPGTAGKALLAQSAAATTAGGVGKRRH